MAVPDMAKKLKQIHPYSVMIYKVGSFYQTYGKDAYIISGMFDYVLKPSGNSVSCGFGENAINKVKNKLEDEKVDYLLLDPRNNYDVDEQSDNNNLNCYENILKKCYTKIKYQKEISHINERLEMLIENNNFKTIIRKIEDVLDEN